MTGRRKRKDPRPICDCDAYNFPHKIGGKCKGRAFLEFYFYCDTSICNECNCYNEDVHCCDALYGKESIKEAECYREQLHYCPGGHLPLQFIEIEE